MLRRFAGFFVALGLVLPLYALADAPGEDGSGPSAREIAERAEDSMRGDSAYTLGVMTVTSPRLPVPRKVRFRSWDDRLAKRSFIRILAPPKDQGTGFLRLHPNLWTYIPRVERTMRIPPSMMLQSWMGSDFSNDDLVRESSQLDDYDHEISQDDTEMNGHDAWQLVYIPHEDAPVVWGKIVIWVEKQHFTPLRADYYDEDGVHLRTMEYDDIREVQGRYYPHRWSMRPLDKEGHHTLIEIEEIRFNEKFDDVTFTTRNLKGRD